MILDRFKLTVRLRSSPAPAPASVSAARSALAEAGANVVLAARTADKLEDAAAEVRKTGAQGARGPDRRQRRRPQLERLVDATLQEFGRIDVLVNNAGGTAPSPALHLSLQGLRGRLPLQRRHRVPAQQALRAAHGGARTAARSSTSRARCPTWSTRASSPTGRRKRRSPT